MELGMGCGVGKDKLSSITLNLGHMHDLCLVNDVFMVVRSVG